MTKPLSPKEAARAQANQIPDEVVEVVNAMIIESLSHGRATIKAKDVAERIAEKLGISVNEVYARRLLDFEPAFRKEGWDVKYDKPGYCESYEAFYEFKVK